MRSLLCLATVAIVALAASAYAQDENKEPAKAELTQAVYMVGNLH